ncbi:TIGR03751 family conjugal transfer lipoprotein [Xenorhabdus bovienii]|nr:TIGR03751 family conjugal transfer lipoprotein [Xenorhabdus bovienii]MDE1485156.1 TIGR03751 family conjugal transfer lipoprotein [Xenorhabdus bovienii]MDE9476019.1 TIGR03751 family conjugal transfer lipoprotein [Xenorhabdus bovienii]MDE9528787.1 TIGR03751 family conjugal transfer lipoprotein [Xenorhabdus bovienii]
MKVKMSIILFLASAFLTGCVTSKEDLMPAGEYNMMEIWQGKTGERVSSKHVTQQARNALSRSLTDKEQTQQLSLSESYSRTQETEINQQFPRLPNPDMVMYVFPHLSPGNLPVPGYSTVFPFYHQVQYAMPGERTETL